jgi:uncharacterized protein
MQILVTGGTGFIGRSLCTRLLAEGHDPIVLTRRPGRNPQPGVRSVAGPGGGQPGRRAVDGWPLDR